MLNKNIFFRYNKASSNSSPPRPSTLPISEPKPVPIRRASTRPQSPQKVRSLIKKQNLINLLRNVNFHVLVFYIYVKLSFRDLFLVRNQ